MSAFDDSIADTVRELGPDDFYWAWRYVRILERFGEIDAQEAAHWRDGLFERMVTLGVETEDLSRPEDPEIGFRS